MNVWGIVGISLAVLVGVMVLVVWLRDLAERRRVRLAKWEVEVRRRFSEAIAATVPRWQGQAPAAPPAPRSPYASMSPLAALQRGGIVPGHTMNRAKNDKSFFGGRGETHSVVYGLRNWKIDAMGRLTAMVYPMCVWTPGENDARCMKYPGTAVTNYTSPSTPKEGYPADHSMADCLHGFYAYYDGSRDYHEKGAVTGVIRGWGEAVVGEKGFRCMKAEIVAIKFAGSTTPQIQEKVQRLYPDVAVFKSLEAMLAEYPTTVGGLEYVPESDDDFWTREA